MTDFEKKENEELVEKLIRGHNKIVYNEHKDMFERITYISSAGLIDNSDIENIINRLIYLVRLERIDKHYIGKDFVELSKREIKLIRNMVVNRVNYGGSIEIISEYLELYEKLIEIT